MRFPAGMPWRETPWNPSQPATIWRESAVRGASVVTVLQPAAGRMSKLCGSPLNSVWMPWCPPVGAPVVVKPVLVADFRGRMFQNSCSHLGLQAMPVHILQADAVDARVGLEFSDYQPGPAGPAHARLSCDGRPSRPCHLCDRCWWGPIRQAGRRGGVNESISAGLAPTRRSSSRGVPPGVGERFASDPVPACGVPVGGEAPARTARIPQAMLILSPYAR